MGPGDRPSSRDEPDFVVGAADGHAQQDEELPHPGGPRARENRLRLELGVGALVLLVALLIAHGLAHRHHTRQAATAPTQTTPTQITPTQTTPTAPSIPTTPVSPSTPTTHPTPAATRVPHPAYPTSIPRRHGTDPAACPGLRCRSSDALPAAVSDAIQAAFPESTVLRAQTVRLSGDSRTLWYREVDVRAGSEELSLQVEAPAKGDRSSAQVQHQSQKHLSNGQTTTVITTMLGPWHVQVDVVDLLGGQPSATALSELAHDPRIVTV